MGKWKEKKQQVENLRGSMGGGDETEEREQSSLKWIFLKRCDLTISSSPNPPKKKKNCSNSYTTCHYFWYGLFVFKKVEAWGKFCDKPQFSSEAAQGGPAVMSR